MSSFLHILNILSLTVSAPSSASQDLSLSLGSKTGQMVNDYTNNDNYFFDVFDSERTYRAGMPNSVSESITNISDHLSTNFPGCYWIKNNNESSLTSDISGYIPIEM